MADHHSSHNHTALPKIGSYIYAQSHPSHPEMVNNIYGDGPNMHYRQSVDFNSQVRVQPIGTNSYIMNAGDWGTRSNGISPRHTTARVNLSIPPTPSAAHSSPRHSRQGQASWQPEYREDRRSRSRGRKEGHREDRHRSRSRHHHRKHEPSRSRNPEGRPHSKDRRSSNTSTTLPRQRAHSAIRPELFQNTSSPTLINTPHTVQPRLAQGLAAIGSNGARAAQMVGRDVDGKSKKHHRESRGCCKNCVHVRGNVVNYYCSHERKKEPHSKPSHSRKSSLKVQPIATARPAPYPAAVLHRSRPSQSRAAPPADWRADYVAPGSKYRTPLAGVASFARNVFQQAVYPHHLDSSIGRGIGQPHIHWNMRESIDKIVSKFNDVHAASSYFQRQAVPFTLGEIIVVHDLLPWEIRIRANASGISVGRVLRKISDALNVGLLPQDTENCKIHDGIRQTIEVAAARRSGGHRRDYRRVDFLGESYMFAGLEHIKDNVFALQSSKP